MNADFDEINEILRKRLDTAKDPAGAQKFFIRTNILEYWNSISDTQRENILMVKQNSVIEGFLQALREPMPTAGCDQKQETCKRVFIYNRDRQPSLKISITEFEHLMRPEESAENKNFYLSVSVLEAEPWEQPAADAENKEVDVLPTIDSAKLSEYIYDAELLDTCRSVIKIRYDRMETIFKTLVGVYDEFCQGYKTIIPEDQYNNIFSLNSIQEILGEEYSNDNQSKTQGKNSASSFPSCKKLFNLLLLIFENNLLSNYSLQTHPYDNAYLPLARQMYYHYPHAYQDLLMQGYGMYLENGPLATPYGMPYYKQLPKQWQGIHIGKLVFKMVDYGLEEEDYNEENRAPYSQHRPEPRTNPRRNDRGTYVIYKPKNTTQENSNPLDPALNAPTNSKDQQLSPLQLSLKQQSSVPLLETVIKLPKANNTSATQNLSYLTVNTKNLGTNQLSGDSQTNIDTNQNSVRQTGSANRKRLRLKQDNSNDFYQNNSHSQEWNRLVASTSPTLNRSNQVLNVQNPIILQKTPQD